MSPGLTVTRPVSVSLGPARPGGHHHDSMLAAAGIADRVGAQAARPGRARLRLARRGAASGPGAAPYY